MNVLIYSRCPIQSHRVKLISHNLSELFLQNHTNDKFFGGTVSNKWQFLLDYLYHSLVLFISWNSFFLRHWTFEFIFITFYKDNRLLKLVKTIPNFVILFINYHARELLYYYWNKIYHTRVKLFRNFFVLSWHFLFFFFFWHKNYTLHIIQLVFTNQSAVKLSKRKTSKRR